MDRQLYLKQKFGEASNAVYDRIAMAGKDAGIDFAFQDIAKTPETSAVHTLLIAAGKHSFSLSERFFQAYSLKGATLVMQKCKKTLSPKKAVRIAIPKKR